MTLGEPLQYIETLHELEDKHIHLYIGRNSKKLYLEKHIAKPCKTSIYQQLMNHPIQGIPRIYKVEEKLDSVIIVEDYIQGQTLEEFIKNKSYSDYVIQQMFIQLCDILSNLHSCKPPIVHRDIKPENIIICKDKVFLCDFDISRNIIDKQNKDTQVLGSLGYAAPEQFGFAQSDARADIYSLGVLLNQVVTKQLPQEKMAQGQFKKIVQKCIQIDPINRYQNAQELKNVLAQLPITKIGVQNKIASYRIPGFRSKSPWKMIIAITFYTFIIYIASSVESSSPDSTIIDTYFSRLSFIFSGIGTVLILFDYRGWLTKNFKFLGKNIILDLLIKLLFSFVFLVATVVNMLILAAIFNAILY